MADTALDYEFKALHRTRGSRLWLEQQRKRGRELRANFCRSG
jgi:hypothetical protein